MILPTKRISYNKSLIVIGGKILKLLNRPKTLSTLWENFKKENGSKEPLYIPYDWFILSLDLLFVIGAITAEGNFLKKNDS